MVDLMLLPLAIRVIITTDTLIPTYFSAGGSTGTEREAQTLYSWRFPQTKLSCLTAVRHITSYPPLAFVSHFFTIAMPAKLAKVTPSRTWTRTLSISAVIIVALSALFYFLDQHLEWFYIFTPGQLHDLSLRAIGAHGNDTRAIVSYIVTELNEKLPGGYVNLDEEWIFNNAGGAMGAMYIIHASKSLPPPLAACLQ